MTLVTRYPSANAAYSGAGLTNPSNAHADDGTAATAAPAKNNGLGTTYSGFGFDGQIPAGSTINSVTIRYQRWCSTTNSVAIARTKARIGGIDEENHDDTQEPTTESGTGNTVAVDVTADRTWARDDLLDANFAAVFEFRRGNTNTAYTGNLDYIRVEVDYTAPANRRGLVSWSEVETPDQPPQDRRGLVTFAELETATAPRRGIVPWAELETESPPTTDRRLLVPWAELETATAPRRSVVPWAEMEAPLSPRRGIFSWAELETPTYTRRGLVVWAEMETEGGVVVVENYPCAPRYVLSHPLRVR